MKSIEIGFNHFPPVAVFDENERHELKAVLKGEYPEQAIELFILQAQNICMIVLSAFHDPKDPTKYQKPSRTPHKKQFAAMRKQFAETREYLEVIAREIGPALRPLFPSRISDVWMTTPEMNSIDQDPAYQANCKAVALAQTALKSLNELEALFEENLDAADLGTVHQEFAERVVEAYRKYLGEPTASVNDPFPYVLQILFRAVQ